MAEKTEQVQMSPDERTEIAAEAVYYAIGDMRQTASWDELSDVGKAKYRMAAVASLSALHAAERQYNRPRFSFAELFNNVG